MICEGFLAPAVGPNDRLSFLVSALLFVLLLIASDCGGNEAEDIAAAAAAKAQFEAAFQGKFFSYEIAKRDNY